MLSSPQEPKVAKLPPEFERHVFINCPFDDEYVPIFEAVVFAVHDAGFRPVGTRHRSRLQDVQPARHRRKSLLIFDSEQYRFRKYVSDLAGQDMHQHGNNPRVAVTRVRGWLRAESDAPIRVGAAIYDRYQTFRRELPELCDNVRLDVERLTFADFSYVVARWLQQQS